MYKRKETKLKEQTLTNLYKRRLIPGKGGVNGKGPTKSEFNYQDYQFIIWTNVISCNATVHQLTSVHLVGGLLTFHLQVKIPIFSWELFSSTVICFKVTGWFLLIDSVISVVWKRTFNKRHLLNTCFGIEFKLKRDLELNCAFDLFQALLYDFENLRP